MEIILWFGVAPPHKPSCFGLSFLKGAIQIPGSIGRRTRASVTDALCFLQKSSGGAIARFAFRAEWVVVVSCVLLWSQKPLVTWNELPDGYPLFRSSAQDWPPSIATLPGINAMRASSHSAAAAPLCTEMLVGSAWAEGCGLWKARADTISEEPARRDAGQAAFSVLEGRHGTPLFFFGLCVTPPQSSAFNDNRMAVGKFFDCRCRHATDAPPIVSSQGQ